MIGKYLTSRKVFKKISILIQSQEVELIDLADRGRRNNLIVFGIPEGFEETDVDVKNSVLIDLLEYRMSVKVSTIERAHILGEKIANRARPINVKFYNYAMSSKCLESEKKKLKGTKISVLFAGHFKS